MPFETGNTAWQKALDARNKNKDDLARLVHEMVNGGYVSYDNKMFRLSNGEEISAPEEQFMDRLERHLEFALPKLARQEHTGANGAPLALAVLHYDALQASKPIELDSVKPVEVSRPIAQILPEASVDSVAAGTTPEVSAVIAKYQAE